MSSSGRSRLRFQLQPVHHQRENSSTSPYVGPILPASTSSLPKKVPIRYGKYASLLRFYEQSSLSRNDVEKLAKLLSSASSKKFPKRHNVDETEASDSDESDVDQLHRTGRVDEHSAREEQSWSSQDAAQKREKLVLSWSDQLKRDDAKVVQVRIPDARVDSDSDEDNLHVVIVTQPSNDTTALNPRIIKHSVAMPLARSKQHERQLEQDDVGRLIDTRLKTMRSAAQSSERAPTASTVTSPPLRRDTSTAWFARAKSHVEDKWQTANAKPSIPLRHTVQDLPFGVTRFGGPSLLQNSPVHADAGKTRYDPQRVRYAATAASRYSLKSSYSNVTRASRDTWSSTEFNVPAPSRMSRERVDSIRVAGTHVNGSSRSYMNIVHSPYFEETRPSRATAVMFAE